MNVTYDYYHIFYYVAKYGSFTKAAQMLGNSQPNITRAMNNLEAQTGVRLLARSKKGIALTPEGEQLYGHVQAAFYHFAVAEAELAREVALSEGMVTIGVNEIALQELLLPVLKEYQAKYPGIQLQVVNRSVPEVLETLRSGQVNMAIVTAPFDVKGSMETVKLKDFRECLVAGSNFAELKKGKHKLSDLEKYPWISAVQGTSTRSFQEKAFAKWGLDFSPHISVATSAQIFPVIKSGLGIGYVPECMLDHVDAEDWFVVEETEQTMRSLYLVTDAEQPISTAAEALIQELLSACTV